MQKEILIFSILLLFFLSFISANGLSIINQSTFSLNKTFETIPQITFVLRNEEPIDFVNINFVSNPYVSMSNTNLVSGENKTITANIIANDDFSGTIRIRGFYNATLGPVLQEHNVTIDSNSQLNRCDFSITQGDSITWLNLDNIPLSLRESGTNLVITTIQPNATYRQTFDNSLQFTYYISPIGLSIPLSGPCTIAVLGTSGLITNPDFDAELILAIKIIFESTAISSTILTDSYSIEAGKSTQDILSIRNIGNKTAKNIHLSGEWFSFTSNNFDLQLGESKNIGYEIRPIVLNTSETNKSYIKNITITGNFDTFTEDFSIFVPFSVITNETFQGSQSFDDLMKVYIEVVKTFCSENPNFEDCTTLIAKFIIGGSINSSASLDTEIAKFLFQFYSEWFESNNLQKQQLDDVNYNISQTAQFSNETASKVSSLEKNVLSNENLGVLLALLFVFTVISGVLIYIIRYTIKKKRMEEYDKYE